MRSQQNRRSNPTSTLPPSPTRTPLTVSPTGKPRTPEPHPWPSSMRRTHTAKSGFLTLCILLGLLVFFAGILVALVAATDPRPATVNPTLPVFFPSDNALSQIPHATLT